MTLTPRRHRRATTAGVTALLALTALTGCAQEEPTNDEVSSSAPTVDDPVVTTSPGDDAAATSSVPDDAAATSSAPEEEDPRSLAAADGSFEIEVPGRWEDAIELVQDERILVAAKDTEFIDDFFTNVVVTQEEQEDNLEEAVRETATELAGEDGEFELLDPVDVDGEEALGYSLVREVPTQAAEGTGDAAEETATAEEASVTVHQTQRWVQRDDTLYVVTFSAVESQADEAADVLDDILASWTWEG